MAYSSDVRNIVKIGDGLFANRSPLMTLWQEIAENFYPERADFLTGRSMGAEYASGLMTSYPVMLRRDLANVFGSFLRPRSTPWLELHASDDARDQDNDARMWLEWASGVQWRAMYDPATQFVRATKEADHDFATFGQAVLSIETNENRDALLYRTWHLRDCAWCENSSGKVDTIHRKWKPEIRQIAAKFPGKLSERLTKLLKDDPYRQIPCRHIVVPSDQYSVTAQGRKKLPYTSLYIEEEDETVLEERSMSWFMYTIPRWMLSGSQYARSPATEIALADGRLIQAVTRVNLEAGEKAVDPPLVGPEGALRSDVNAFAGGLTTYDIDYDERSGEALRPLMDTTKGMPIGFEMVDRIQAAMKEAFFLNKLTLPEFTRQTTAFQVRKMVEDMIRQQAPIFEPIEEEYSAPLTNTTFDVLMAMGAFGPRNLVPPALQGAQIHFTFKSPLREIADEMKAQQLAEGLQLVEQVSAIDPAQTANINATEATRDALRGIGWSAKWINDKKAVEDKAAQIAQQQTNQTGASALATGGDIAHKFGQAANQLSQAGLTQ